jgi:hypothetical protein
VIADMGINFLERQVLRRGHQLVRVSQPEYGTDAQMRHFSPYSREIENGWVEFQVKATDHVAFVDGERFVTSTVEMAHVHYWYWQVYQPFILVLYDAQKHRAFWVDVQSYVQTHEPLEQADQETVTLRIPTDNTLTVRAIDRFREMSLARQASLP